MHVVNLVIPASFARSLWCFAQWAANLDFTHLSSRRAKRIISRSGGLNVRVHLIPALALLLGNSGYFSGNPEISKQKPDAQNRSQRQQLPDAIVVILEQPAIRIARARPSLHPAESSCPHFSDKLHLRERQTAVSYHYDGFKCFLSAVV
jgi:hypothetical protein